MPDATPTREAMIQGTLDLLILQTLRWGPRHGYAISQAIRQGSRDVFLVETGSLYPALQRLEKRGFVVAEWGLSDNKQQARFYQLTPAGRGHLDAEQSRWATLIGAFQAVMHSQEQEG
jgi:PadR family transcriptional regulator PadR